jgi:hypothetical protein
MYVMEHNKIISFHQSQREKIIMRVLQMGIRARHSTSTLQHGHKYDALCLCRADIWQDDGPPCCPYRANA